ncbi:MAG: hypothetical protein ACKV19_04040 [Verrucomicrobiales bacterium]
MKQLTTILCTFSLLCGFARSEPQPNFIVININDMGYADSPLPTPPPHDPRPLHQRRPPKANSFQKT